MDPDRHFDAEDVSRYEALLQMADLAVHYRGVPEMLPQLAQRLRKVASVEVASFALYDPDKKLMRLHFWKEVIVFLTSPSCRWKNRLVDSCGIAAANDLARPAAGNPLPGSGQHSHRKKGVRSYCGLPLTSGQKKFGALELGSQRPTLIAKKMCSFCGKLPNWSRWTGKREYSSRLSRGEGTAGVLLEMGTTLMSNLDVQQLFPNISALSVESSARTLPA